MHSVEEGMEVRDWDQRCSLYSWPRRNSWETSDVYDTYHMIWSEEGEEALLAVRKRIFKRCVWQCGTVTEGSNILNPNKRGWTACFKHCALLYHRDVPDSVYSHHRFYLSSITWARGMIVSVIWPLYSSSVNINIEQRTFRHHMDKQHSVVLFALPIKIVPKVVTAGCSVACCHANVDYQPIKLVYWNSLFNVWSLIW